MGGKKKPKAQVLGLSDKEITPILQNKFKRNTIGKYALPTNKAKTAIESTESVLGNLYEELGNSPKAMKPASNKQIGTS